MWKTDAPTIRISSYGHGSKAAAIDHLLGLRETRKQKHLTFNQVLRLTMGHMSVLHTMHAN